MCIQKNVYQLFIITCLETVFVLKNNYHVHVH